MASTDPILAVKALLSCVKADGNAVSHAIVEEKKIEAKLKRLTLSDLGPGMILIETDAGRGTSGRMSPLFSDNNDYDHNRVCDAVLLRKSDDGIHACYIELKSDSPSGYEGQFLSTRCFMRYLVELAKALCDVEISFTRERFVVFHTDSSNMARRGKKTKTRFSPNSANRPNSPDKFCVRNDDTVRCSEFF